jgi:phospholipase A1
MRLQSLLAGILLLSVAVVSASELAFTVMPPSGPVVPGQTIQVDVVGINPLTRETPFDLAATLSGTFKTAGQAFPVTLHSTGGFPAAIGPGGFGARKFNVEVPDSAMGDAILEINWADKVALRAVIPVVPSAAGKSGNENGETPLDRLVASAPASAALARNFAGRFQPNLPIYFIYGGGEQAAKYQLSFDYRLATLVLGSAGNETVATLRAGYTQRSLWDIDGSSSPFYDTSYMPELAISTEAPMPQDRNRWLTWMGLRAGVQHESNGRDGPDSRSLNVFYVRPRLALGSIDSWFFLLLPEVHAYLGDLGDNGDLKDYRGYGRLRFYLGRNDGPSLMLSGWAGKDFDHASYQLDLAVPTQLRWTNFEAYLYAQYFNGYGESLRSHRVKSDALRVGFSLVR